MLLKTSYTTQDKWIDSQRDRQCNSRHWQWLLHLTTNLAALLHNRSVQKGIIFDVDINCPGSSFMFQPRMYHCCTTSTSLDMEMNFSCLRPPSLSHCHYRYIFHSRSGSPMSCLAITYNTTTSLQQQYVYLSANEAYKLQSLFLGQSHIRKRGDWPNLKKNLKVSWLNTPVWQLQLRKSCIENGGHRKEHQRAEMFTHGSIS